MRYLITKGRDYKLEKLTVSDARIAFLTRCAKAIPLILVEYVTKVRVTMEMMSILKK